MSRHINSQTTINNDIDNLWSGSSRIAYNNTSVIAPRKGSYIPQSKLKIKIRKPLFVSSESLSSSDDTKGGIEDLLR